MKLSEELAWRGFSHQTTLDSLAKLDNYKDKKFYHGYDAASADSLTIGNLAAVMMDKVFVRHGWEAVILAGGATSLVGDPGGKDAERTLQSEEQVRANVKAVKVQLEKLFGESVDMVNNLDWFKDMKLLDFLRDVGKHFSMTPLVQRDYIATRMGRGGTGISYTEFSYTLLQGYDFLHLYREKKVSLQLAGSDQWGNGLSGVELVRRVEGAEVHVLSCPLVVNKVTGKKFGKSEAGAVWLDKTKTSPYEFYQFWLNLDDDGVEDYLKIFTELSKEQVDETMRIFLADKPSRAAQKRLAYEVTKLVHGEAEAKNQEAALPVVGSNNVDISKGAQYHVVKQTNDIVETLVKTGLASSKTEARQLLSAGGVYINGVQTTKSHFDDSDFHGGLLKLRRGKTLKNTVIIKRG